MTTAPDPSAPNITPTADRDRYITLVEAATGTPFRTGNDLTILQNGDEIFPAMLEAIRAAQTSIEFVTYVYWHSKIANEFADALSDRARAGVAVRLLVDAVGGAIMNSRTVWQLERAGVKVAWFRPARWQYLRKLNNRTHRKVLVIDNHLGFVGGVGIADEWTGAADSPKHWRETHCAITGPACADLQASFAENWLEATGERLAVGETAAPEGETPAATGERSEPAGVGTDTVPTEETDGVRRREEHSPIADPGPEHAQIETASTESTPPAPTDPIASEPPPHQRAAPGPASRPVYHNIAIHTTSSTAGARPTAIERLFLEVIAASRHRLWITTAYFVPNPHFTRALASAVERGVDVRVLTNGPLSNHRLTHLAGRASYQALLDAGVHIYEYYGTVLHAKVLTVDHAWATIGSTNFDDRSLILNDELNISVVEPGLISALDARFEVDLAKSRAIRNPHWAGRGWPSRLAESGASLFRHQL